MAVYNVGKCVRPDCNTYAIDLDGRTPCEECRKKGVHAPPAPLRPTIRVDLRPQRPQRPATFAELAEAARGGIQLGREFADAFRKIRRALR